MRPRCYGTTASPVSASLGAMAPGSTWHYRIVAQNGETTVVGADMSFTTLAPEIRVFAGADETAPELVDGQTNAVDFGSTPLGAPVVRSFTVKNAGTSDLQVTTLSLPAVYECVGGAFAPFTLAPNATHTLQVRFLSNTVKGIFGGSMIFTNDDGDEAPFNFPLTATAFNGLNPATLDATFGTGGKVTSNISHSPAAESLAIQSDGKIILAGFAYNLGGGTNDFAVARYTASGALDPTFGNGGFVLTPIGSGSDLGHSVVVQSDGKIVVAGQSSNGSNEEIALVRYNSNGMLDTTFSGDGKMTVAVGTDHAIGRSVVVQSDGKIVVAGSSATGGVTDFVAVRLTAGGALDTTFSADGIATAALGTNGAVARSVALQSDGRMVLAGPAYDSQGYADFAAARFTSSGVLDSSFGFGGTVVTPIGSTGDIAFSVAIQSDGKMVVAGYFQNGTKTDFSVVRYTISGFLDTSFSADGKVTTPIGSGDDIGRGVLIQGDGRIVVGGNSANGTDTDFAMLRYLSNGELDPGFGGGGKVTTPVGSGTDLGWAVALQSDGKIVLGGTAYEGSNSRFALVRYGSDLTATVATTAASTVTQTAATLNGTVNPNGVLTTAWFEYGLTTSYGATTTIQLQGYGTTANSVNAALTGLTPATAYHYRIVTQNGETTVVGVDMIFTTSEASAPSGGTMALTPGYIFDAGSPYTVDFLGWIDASPPLSYSVLLNNIEVSPVGPSASRNLTAPLAPGGYTIEGRISDALGNTASVTQGLTVLTAQESWRRFHFGTWFNTGNTADTADPDGDGHDNFFEFVAGLVPNSPASRFSLRVEPVAGQPARKAVIFRPRLADRAYVVKYKTSLTDPAWLPLPDITTSDSANERTITDLSAGDGVRFYTVEITLP